MWSSLTLAGKYTGKTTLVRTEEHDTITALERDGTVRWQFENPHGLADVTVGDNTAYTTGEDGYLYALDF
ncbi:PQQ-binding-like beta-propeller repeat protein [Haladaptatus sp. DFWS20]|uniref:PQQ-binding-like beta-propeller repeat protein n=1 Tax=Haladaptatus sp. DFWS20 TaxID=3403467 RepID=UPI003EBDCCC5